MTESKTNWYEQWFGKTYLELYPHRDDASAAKEIDFIVNFVEKYSIRPIRDVIDVACGAGRHLVQLANKDLAVTGLDLSEELIDVAKKRQVKEKFAAHIIHGDMRELPFAAHSFDLLLSMFTSFGYFEKDETNEAMLNHWHNKLRDSGVIFIDFLNRYLVKETLVPRSTRKIDEKVIEEKRSITKDGKRVEKQIKISYQGEEKSFLESVRMFSRTDIKGMLSRNGFSEITFFGDFDGSEFTKDSPRLLIFAKAQ